MPNQINVVIVDDFELSRVGLKYMLSNIHYVSEIFQATNSKELFDIMSKHDPDFVFMDVMLGDESGISVTQQLLLKHPNTYVIAITSSKDIQHFIDMIDAGAAGFLLKNVTNAELEFALNEILNGNTYSSKEFLAVSKKLAPQQSKKSRINLSAREKEVLRYICLGLSNQEIADKLNLSPHTIDAHRKKLLAKTGARNTASMITLTIKEGLIEPF